MTSKEVIIQFEEVKLSICQPAQKFSSKIQDEPKQILKSLSGYFKKGLNAILGSSGAGKTSFLNVIAQRVEKTQNVQLSGQLTINNTPYDQKSFKKQAGYVMQDDHLLASLTVKEYFQFAADMKLNCSQQEKEEKVNNLIKMLQLTRCQDTLIGDHIIKGISGGERKRCSIGMELIGEPQILILDEPTSGLDSFTSYKLICLLKQIAERDNCTIIFTIHQPSSDIWNLFDRILLMTEGKFIYQGEGNKIINYFNSIGLNCPIYSNPADYLMEIMNNNFNKREKTEHIIEQYNKNIENKIKEEMSQLNTMIMNQNDQLKQIKIEEKTRIKTMYMFKTLLKRQIRLLMRNRIMIYARLFQVLVMGLFNGAVYYNIGEDVSSYTDSYNLAAFLYVIQLGMFSQSLNPQVIVFSTERPIYLKEVSSNLYTTGTYFLSKIIPEFVTCSIFPIIMSNIIYWLSGLSSDPQVYFFYLLVFILQSNVGNSFGILSGCMFAETRVAIQFAITFIVPQVLFGGFSKNRNDYGSWIGWFQYITPTFYAFNATVVNEFEAHDYEYSPVDYMSLNLDKWFCVGMLALLYFVFNLTAYLVLKSKTKNIQ